MNIDLQLELLLNKYSMRCKYDEVSFFEKYIIDTWDKIPKNTKIAVWGAGDHTIELLKLVNHKETNIVCIIDKNKELSGKTISGYKIVWYGDIEKYDIDIIIISTHKYRKYIAEKIQGKYKYIDFYEFIEKINITDWPFYWYKRTFKYYKNSIDVFIIRNLYNTEESIENKQKLLLELIKKYLSFKDFIYAFKFIKIYIDNKYENYKYIECFYAELKTLLTLIKKEVINKKNNNLIMFIMDSFRYSDLVENEESIKNLPYLSQLYKKSLFYNNAYANSTYTKACINSIFYGALISNNEINKNNYELEWKNSKLIKYMLSDDYEIINNSTVKFIPDNRYIKNIIEDKKQVQSCSEQFWNIIKNICGNNEKKIFYISHILESHILHVCNYHKNEIDLTYNEDRYIKVKNEPQKAIKFWKLYLECINYIDKQMEFYSEFISDTNYKIITSDHGQLFGEYNMVGFFYTWYDPIIHVPLIINHKSIKVEEIDNMFSMHNLSHLIIGFLKENKRKDLASKHVRIERDEIYNLDLINNREFMEVFNPNFIKEFKIIRTKGEKYIYYANGIEELYILPDEKNNVINRKQFSDKVKRIRKALK